jgi:hypothetical protein
MGLATRAEFERLFDRFTRSAWRLECQGVYNEPEEREPLKRFLAGEPDDGAWFADWPVWIRAQRAAGRTVSRVRVMTEPLTDYLRFQFTITPPAVEAGEDIRLLPAAAFAALDLPREDFWLFDDTVVALLHFGDDGVAGVEIITDDPTVATFRERRRRTWDAAFPYR